MEDYKKYPELAYCNPEVDPSTLTQEQLYQRATRHKLRLQTFTELAANTTPGKAFAVQENAPSASVQFLSVLKEMQERQDSGAAPKEPAEHCAFPPVETVLLWLLDMLDCQHRLEAFKEDETEATASA